MLMQTTETPLELVSNPLVLIGLGIGGGPLFILWLIGKQSENAGINTNAPDDPGEAMRYYQAKYEEAKRLHERDAGLDTLRDEMREMRELLKQMMEKN